MWRAVAGLALLLVSGTSAAEFSGNVALEALVFSESPQFEGQYDNSTTLSFEPRWSGDWNDGDDRWSVELFLRADEQDEGREHADIRELLWLRIDGDNEWRVGINTMFWGVAESRHLVDVINQIDQVEGVDGEEKLGQPMLHLKRYADWGVVDLLLLAGFRERTFQAEAGRLRTSPVVDTEQVAYESADAQRHIDYAIRYSQTYGDLDLGLSWFDGTSRDPLLLPGADEDGAAVLIPFYEQMIQFGVDAQLIDGDWIWRLELIRREAASTDRNAAVFGFEYTFYAILESAVDFGALVEYSYDDAPRDLRGPFDRDLFVGGRFGFNDVQSSEILAGFIVDTELYSRSFRVEGSRRFGDSWKGSLELQTFTNIDYDDVLAAVASDDFIRVEMAYYF